MHRDARLISVMIVTGLLWASACAPRALQRASPQPAMAQPIVWPPAPQPPRVRFVKAIAHPQDLGMRTSLWWGVVERLVGKSETEAFVRPTGVVATEQTIYIADPGAQALRILNLKAKRERCIRQAGGRRLVSPVAVALGPHDGIFVADSYLAKVFVYDATGKLRTTIASRDLKRPVGVAYDAARDRLYVADSAAHCVWVMNGGGVTQGAIGRRGDGDGEFNFPTHVAVSASGSLYVTDALGFRVQWFTPDGTFAGMFGRHGDVSGEFAMPKGIAVDSDGHIYVVEALFDAVQIFDRAGRFLLSFGEQGAQPGQFWLPNGIWIDPTDRIYVADSYNQRVQVFQYVSHPDGS